MNVAIFGSGSMAHFLAQFLKKNSKVENIYVYGLDIDEPDCIYVPPPKFKQDDFSEYKKYFADAAYKLKENNIDLVITTTLTFQLWKGFQQLIAETGIPAILPSEECGMLEWSKATTKNIFKELEIPTTEFVVLTKEELLRQFYNFELPFVIKVDRDYREGLQTTVVTDENKDAVYNALLSNQKHLKISSSDTEYMVVEQFVKGKEYSYHLLCNGSTCTFVGASRDYKKYNNGDQGHNTSGMGSYSPVAYVDHRVKEYGDKILSYLNAKGIEYVGILYLGILVDDNNNHLLLEVNTRFGCPESESWILTLEDDLLDLFYAAASKKPLPTTISIDKCAVSIRLVAKEYGLVKEETTPPTLKPSEDIIISRSTSLINSFAVLSTVSDSFEKSSNILYDYLNEIDIGDYRYRTDIGLLL